ncbi:hypothetical protein M422DRAFT_243646 [Sphaerobolus stellatus SS14]|nr:hypothetical protein M422DRAFT_243646 [Sphaerobolus stellatus SS14]
MTRNTEPSFHDIKRGDRELKDVTVEKSETLADDARAVPNTMQAVQKPPRIP